MAENFQTPNEQASGGTDTRLSTDRQTRKRGLGRWAGLGVFVAVAFPIVAAYIVFYTGVGMPMDTVNQGELLVPAHNVADISLRSDDGATVAIASEEPKWRYLIIGGEQCAGECEKLLYTTRQVHIRLGDKAHRVERLLVTGDALTAERHQDLASQHPKLRFTTADQQQIDQWLADSDHAALKRPSALLVDQKGFAMMVYDNRYTGNQLLKDIKRLLKYSYEK
ncbi:hypothetical protein [Microbulbifer sp. ALW1]|uniref:SCO family protein n=1 Tax=Microbulbifer sp. (strain ALW1) TaxID=1516059 RepID=UPI001912CD4D|nr:hypothetical protein [Microbulbifer sp. ALW1]